MRLFTTVLMVTLLTGCAGNGANSDVDDSLITLPKDSKSPMNPTNTNLTDESKAQEKQPVKAEDEGESGLDDKVPEEPVKAEDEGGSGFVTTKSDIKDILSDNTKEGALYHSSTLGPEESLLLYEVDNESGLELETKSEKTFNIYIPED